MNADPSLQAFITSCYRFFLHRDPDAAGQQYFLNKLVGGASMVEVMREFNESTENSRSGMADLWVPAGHFYSPNPSRAEVGEHKARGAKPLEFPAVDLNLDGQRALLEVFAELYKTLPFEDNPNQRNRYGYVNSSYPAGDSIALHCFLRHLQPKRLIEVGCGNSTCAILDTCEQFVTHPVDITLVEPYPEFLKSRIRPEDFNWVKLKTSRLQDVPLSTFQALETNDVLFIDSTHVSKLNSDVNYLFFEVLPCLKPGVFIHIHDIFDPFEYPTEWLEEGRAWSENYMLRAFLQYNETFRIRFFNTLMMNRHEAWFAQNMPKCLSSRGGSIWLEKVK